MSNSEKEIITEDETAVKNDWRLFCLLNMTKIKVICGVIVLIILAMIASVILTLVIMQDDSTPIKFKITQFEKSSKILRSTREVSKNLLKRNDEMREFLDSKNEEILHDENSMIKKRENDDLKNSIRKVENDFLDPTSDERMQFIEEDLEDINENFKMIEMDIDELLKTRNIHKREKREIERNEHDEMIRKKREYFLTKLEEKKREKRLAQEHFSDVREEFIRCKKSAEDPQQCEDIYQKLKLSFNSITEKLHEIEQIIKAMETEARMVEEDENVEFDLLHGIKKTIKKLKKKKKLKLLFGRTSSEESFESEEIAEDTTTMTTEVATEETLGETTTIQNIDSSESPEDIESHSLLSAISRPATESCPAESVMNDEIRRHPMFAEELDDFKHKMGHEHQHHSVDHVVDKKFNKQISDDATENIVGRIIDIYGSPNAQRNQAQNRQINRDKIDPNMSGPFMSLCDQMSKQQHMHSQSQPQGLNVVPFSAFPTTAEASKGSSKVVMNPGFAGGYPICFVNQPQPQNFIYPVMPQYQMHPQFVYPTAIAGNYRPMANFQPATSYREDNPTTFCTFDAASNIVLPTQSSTTESPPKIDERHDDNVPSPFDIIFATIPNQMLRDFNRSNQNACDEGKISCLTTSQCILKSNWCDSTVDCLDGSDETACNCKSRLHSSRICDGYADCPMGSDEMGCFGCDKFQHSCYSSVEEFQANSVGGLSCYSVTEKCDGFMNCRNGRDESDCSMLIKNVGSMISPFLVGYSEGVLYRNFKGKWYLVCDAPRKWMSEACEIEVGQKSEPNFEVRNVDIQGPFISEVEMTVSIHEACKKNSEKNDVIIVRCAKPKCGSSRIHENQIEIPERRVKREDNEVTLNRIVGGIDALPMEFPFMVAIFRDGIFHCGGSIFNEEFIVTAAHCLKDSKSHFYEIRAGILRRSSFSSQSQVTQATHVIAHADYSPMTMASDIGLIRVKTPFSYNRWVRPVCLPKVLKSPKNIPAPKTICSTLGWGALTERGSDPDGLRVVDVPIHQKCKYQVDEISGSICAGEVFGSRDACQGDSGGPLVCKSTSGSWILAGIVSHGQGCARANEPGVYTRVSMFNDWIKEQIENLDLESEFTTCKRECPGTTCVWGVQKCLPRHKVCDGVVDCLGGEDEVSCANNWLNNFSLDNLLSKSLTNFTDPFQHDEIKVDQHDKKEEKKKIVKKDVPRKKFECSIIHQIINYDHRCDHTNDCEDGTDEVNCTCADQLMHHFPQLICDGTVDCFDASDELGCLNCTEHQFACRQSKICIENEQRCDGQLDCKFKEDERFCMTLSDGNSVSLDINGMPILHQKGLVTQNIKSSWGVLCDKNFIEKRNEVANSVCQLIGFHGAQFSRPVDMKFFKKLSEFSETTKQTPKVINVTNLIQRERIEEPETECVALEVECLSFQSNISVHHLIHAENLKQNQTKNVSSSVSWPWTTMIFINGKFSVIGVLMNKNWVLVNKNSVDDYEHLLEGNNVVAVLANPHLKMNIQSSEEQIRKIDCIRELNNTSALLFHLKDPIEFNRYVMPSLLQNETVPDRNCIALTLDSDQNFHKVLLHTKNCSKQVCFQIHDNMKAKFDCSATPTTEPAIIMCKSDSTSWYPKAMTRKNICDFKGDIHARMINSKELQHAFDSPCYECKRQTSIIDCPTHLCPLGNCLSKHEVCDGKKNCHDGSDEFNCTIPEPCSLTKFQCRNGNCIEKSKFCDHINDCGDKTDEPSECTCFSFLKTTSPDKICDGIRNCWDRADEDPHYCGRTIPEKFSFKCGQSAFVVPMEMVCDGRHDCPNGVDEMECIKLSKLNAEGFGEVMKRSFGVWHSECFSKSDEVDIDEIGKKICKSLNFEVKIVNHNVNDTEETQIMIDAGKAIPTEFQKSPATKVVSDTKFSAVKLNDGFTVHLRSDKPLTKLVEWDDDDHENCHRLEIKCGQ